jgi:hypothetical protein
MTTLVRTSAGPGAAAAVVAVARRTRTVGLPLAIRTTVGLPLAIPSGTRTIGLPLAIRTTVRLPLTVGATVGLPLAIPSGTRTIGLPLTVGTTVRLPLTIGTTVGLPLTVPRGTRTIGLPLTVPRRTRTIGLLLTVPRRARTLRLPAAVVGARAVRTFVVPTRPAVAIAFRTRSASAIVACSGLAIPSPRSSVLAGALVARAVLRRIAHESSCRVGSRRGLNRTAVTGDGALNEEWPPASARN